MPSHRADLEFALGKAVQPDVQLAAHVQLAYSVSLPGLFMILIRPGWIVLSTGPDYLILLTV